MSRERDRLEEPHEEHYGWQRWGPYVSERSWATVREDYSDNGDAWGYFPHDMARSRAYRWGEDGIAAICDRYQLLVFAPAFWNGVDPILKERLFGLTSIEGNHGEDVKEYYFHLDNTPTHSYMKYLYKYPQGAFPYARLVEENARRSTHDFEYELLETGIFDDDRYFDIVIEYAKLSAPRTSRSGSRRSTAAPTPRRCTSCRTSGSATPGRSGTGTTRRPRIVPGKSGLTVSIARHGRLVRHLPGDRPRHLSPGPAPLLRPGGREAPLHRQRDEQVADRGAGPPEPEQLRQGRLPSPSHRRRGLRQSARVRHEVGHPLRIPRDPARRLGRPPIPPDRHAARGRPAGGRRPPGRGPPRPRPTSSTRPSTPRARPTTRSRSSARRCRASSGRSRRISSTSTSGSRATTPTGPRPGAAGRSATADGGT